MIYLNEETTRQRITHELAYAAVKDAYLAVGESATLFPVVNAAGDQPGSMFSLKSASTPNVVGWKTGSYWPENSHKGMPCHNTAIFLLDPETGGLMATIEAGEVNAYRTAAADAVATDALARKDASILTVFGTGHQAYYEVSAVCAIRDIEQIWVVGRNEARAIALVEKLRNDGLVADACGFGKNVTAKQACECSDIVVTVTTAQSPLFDADWIQPGTHVSAMGADKVGKKEIPTKLFERATLFCDYEKQSRVIGEFQHANSGIEIIEMHRVLVQPTLGRNSDKQITIFDSSGIALQDLFVAERLLNEEE